MKQYEMMELSFNGPIPTGSMVDIELKGTFECNGNQKEVKGFYAGGGIYKVRFYPQEVGTYQWCVEGVVEATGEAVCVTNPDATGMVKVDGLHFKYESGKSYKPFGTTVYALDRKSVV